MASTAFDLDNDAAEVGVGEFAVQCQELQQRVAADPQAAAGALQLLSDAGPPCASDALEHAFALEAVKCMAQVVLALLLPDLQQCARATAFESLLVFVASPLSGAANATRPSGAVAPGGQTASAAALPRAAVEADEVDERAAALGAPLREALASAVAFTAALQQGCPKACAYVQVELVPLMHSLQASAEAASDICGPLADAAASETAPLSREVQRVPERLRARMDGASLLTRALLCLDRDSSAGVLTHVLSHCMTGADPLAATAKVVCRLVVAAVAESLRHDCPNPAMPSSEDAPPAPPPGTLDSDCLAALLSAFADHIPFVCSELPLPRATALLGELMPLCAWHPVVADACLVTVERLCGTALEPPTTAAAEDVAHAALLAQNLLVLLLRFAPELEVGSDAARISDVCRVLLRWPTPPAASPSDEDGVCDTLAVLLRARGASLVAQQLRAHRHALDRARRDSQQQTTHPLGGTALAPRPPPGYRPSALAILFGAGAAARAPGDLTRPVARSVAPPRDSRDPVATTDVAADAGNAAQTLLDVVACELVEYASDVLSGDEWPEAASAESSQRAARPAALVHSATGGAVAAVRALVGDAAGVPWLERLGSGCVGGDDRAGAAREQAPRVSFLAVPLPALLQGADAALRLLAEVKGERAASATPESVALLEKLAAAAHAALALPQASLAHDAALAHCLAAALDSCCLDTAAHSAPPQSTGAASVAAPPPLWLRLASCHERLCDRVFRLMPLQGGAEASAAAESVLTTAPAATPQASPEMFGLACEAPLRVVERTAAVRGKLLPGVPAVTSLARECLELLRVSPPREPLPHRVQLHPPGKPAAAAARALLPFLVAAAVAGALGGEPHHIAEAEREASSSADASVGRGMHWQAQLLEMLVAVVRCEAASGGPPAGLALAGVAAVTRQVVAAWRSLPTDGAGAEAPRDATYEALLKLCDHLVPPKVRDRVCAHVAWLLHPPMSTSTFNAARSTASGRPLAATAVALAAHVLCATGSAPAPACASRGWGVATGLIAASRAASSFPLPAAPGEAAGAGGVKSKRSSARPDADGAPPKRRRLSPTRTATAAAERGALGTPGTGARADASPAASRLDVGCAHVLALSPAAAVHADASAVEASSPPPPPVGTPEAGARPEDVAGGATAALDACLRACGWGGSSESAHGPQTCPGASAEAALELAALLAEVERAHGALGDPDRPSVAGAASGGRSDSTLHESAERGCSGGVHDQPGASGRAARGVTSALDPAVLLSALGALLPAHRLPRRRVIPPPTPAGPQSGDPEAAGGRPEAVTAGAVVQSAPAVSSQLTLQFLAVRGDWASEGAVAAIAALGFCSHARGVGGGALGLPHWVGAPARRLLDGWSGGGPADVRVAAEVVAALGRARWARGLSAAAADAAVHALLLRLAAAAERAAAGLLGRLRASFAPAAALPPTTPQPQAAAPPFQSPTADRAAALRASPSARPVGDGHEQDSEDDSLGVLALTCVCVAHLSTALAADLRPVSLVAAEFDAAGGGCGLTTPFDAGDALCGAASGAAWAPALVSLAAMLADVGGAVAELVGDAVAAAGSDPLPPTRGTAQPPLPPIPSALLHRCVRLLAACQHMATCAVDVVARFAADGPLDGVLAPNTSAGGPLQQRPDRPADGAAARGRFGDRAAGAAGGGGIALAGEAGGGVALPHDDVGDEGAWPGGGACAALEGACAAIDDLSLLLSHLRERSAAPDLAAEERLRTHAGDEDRGAAAAAAGSQAESESEPPPRRPPTCSAADGCGADAGWNSSAAAAAEGAWDGLQRTWDGAAADLEAFLKASPAPDEGCPAASPPRHAPPTAAPSTPGVPMASAAGDADRAASGDAIHEDVAWLSLPRQIPANDSRVRSVLAELFSHTSAAGAAAAAAAVGGPSDRSARAAPTNGRRLSRAAVDSDVMQLVSAVVDDSASEGESVHSDEDTGSDDDDDDDEERASASGADASDEASGDDEDDEVRGGDERSGGDGGGEGGEAGLQASEAAASAAATGARARRRASGRAGRCGNAYLEAVRELEGGGCDDMRDLEDFIVCEEGRDYKQLLRTRYCS